MPASAKYDITLNAEGYSLLSESYRKEAQVPFNPRFSTGDPSLGDLSYWQYIGMDSFAGGINQTKFDQKNKGFVSYGWNTDPLQKALLPSPDAIIGSTVNLTGHANTRGFLQRVKATSIDSITIVGVPNGDWSSTLTSISGPHVTGVQEIYSVPSPCVEYFSRDISTTEGSQGFIIGKRGSVDFLDPIDLSVIASYTVTSDSDISITCAIQCTVDVFFFAGFKPNASGDNTSIFHFVKFADDSMTSTVWTITYEIGFFVPVKAILDAQGNLWVLTTRRASANPSAATDPWVPIESSTLKGSFLYRFAAGSLDTEPYIDITQPLPNYTFYDMALLGTNIYLFGQKVYLMETTVVPVIYKVGFGEIFTQERYTGNVIITSGIHGVYASPHRILFGFVTNGTLDNGYQAVIYALYPGDQIHTIATTKCSSTSIVNGVWEVGREVMMHLNANNSGNNSYIRFAPQTTAASPDGGIFWASSIFTADSFLIDKYLREVTVELTRVQPTGQTVTVYIQIGGGTWTSLGTFSTGQSSKTFTINSTASNWKIGFASVNSADGVNAAGILSLMCKFVPTALRKYQWSMGLRLEQNQQLHDKGFENETTATKLADLWAAYRDNTVITFVDVDGASYSVIVTNIIQRSPILSDLTGNLEYIPFIELLEV